MDHFLKVMIVLVLLVVVELEHLHQPSINNSIKDLPIPSTMVSLTNFSNGEKDVLQKLMQSLVLNKPSMVDHILRVLIALVLMVVGQMWEDSNLIHRTFKTMPTVFISRTMVEVQL
jgi:hypothetical protein